MGPVNTMGQDSLERAVREAGIEVPPVWFDEVGSTNDEAWRLALEGAPAWTVVAAGHQTAGRGRLGRTWVDVPGNALLFSVVLRPRIAPPRLPLITLAAARDMIEAAQVPSLRCKWPNDLVVGGRKCGGILAEAELVGDAVMHVVLGMGINLSGRENDLPEGIRAGATSLIFEGTTGPHAQTLLAAFLRVFRVDVERPAFPRGVVERYRYVCATVGSRVRISMASGEQFEGLALDLDDAGGLVVAVGAERHVIALGEVSHLG